MVPAGPLRGMTVGHFGQGPTSFDQAPPPHLPNVLVEAPILVG